MRQLFILMLGCMAVPAFAQNWSVKKLIDDKQKAGAVFKSIPAFTFIADKTIPNQGIYQQLRLNANFRRQLMQDRPAAIQLTLPLDGGKSITCLMVKFSLGNIKFTENNEGTIENIRIPVSYRGIVEGVQERNNVTLCVNDDYISLVAAFPDKTFQVTKADEGDKSLYRLYNSTKILFPVAVLDCGTKDITTTKTPTGIDLTGSNPAVPAAVSDKCVNVFVDCFDSLYIWRGKVPQQTINYVYELYTSVTTGYLNEQINIQITTINIWTTPDPYRGDTRENALADLASNYKDNFWGNICVGLDYSVSGSGRFGLADDIARVKGVAVNTCPAYGTNVSACCYNDLDYNVSVQNFPTGPNTTGAQVYLVMHEMGHLLGAHHTQWCGWKLSSNPDKFGTIDSCGPIEGTCAQGPPPPSNGSTIMSYCVSGVGAGNFSNYNNGFGPLPGAAIRTFVNESLCILNCVDCFGLNNKSSLNDLATETPAQPPLPPENKESNAASGMLQQTATLNPSQKTKR